MDMSYMDPDSYSGQYLKDEENKAMNDTCIPSQQKCQTIFRYVVVNLIFWE